MQRIALRRQISLLQRFHHRFPRRQAGGENVGPAVVVVVEEKTDEAVMRRLQDAGFLRDLREVPVTIVVI